MTKAELINSIVSEMQAARATEQSERDLAHFLALKDKVYASHDKQVRALTMQLGKQQAQNQDTAKTKAALAKATADRDRAFAKYNTAPKKPTCPKCKSTGYHNSKICPCVFKQYTKKLIEQSGFTSDAPKSFDKGTPEIFRDLKTKIEYENIYNKLAQYCEKFPAVKIPNIILCGAAGSGKTYAAHIIANNLMERGFSVLYLTAFSLIERFKKYIQSFNDNQALDALFDSDLLIIDDLGTEPIIKNISSEYLYTVINERLARNKPFLITTNLSPDDLLARYDQRITSRILAKNTTALIEMKSPDLRLN